uniref:uncharacterized protein LOC120344782 n=1 Tax=Styela clava TaxID=7725 RepID=UPI0019396A77|nr:uncharacterized protein LOC120344782 [Styela clava]
MKMILKFWLLFGGAIVIQSLGAIGDFPCNGGICKEFTLTAEQMRDIENNPEILKFIREQVERQLVNSNSDGKVLNPNIKIETSVFGPMRPNDHPVESTTYKFTTHAPTVTNSEAKVDTTTTKQTSSTPNVPATTKESSNPITAKNCTDGCMILNEAGYHNGVKFPTIDGTFLINIPSIDETHNSKIVSVFCDCHEIDQYSFTVIQRRIDNTSNFNRTYAEYENGFGDVERNFWLGLKNIHVLSKTNTLLVIKLRDNSGNIEEAWFTGFSVGSITDNYPLTYHATNIPWMKNGSIFSAFDRDNFRDPDSSLSRIYNSGWWFGDTMKSNLNGNYDGRGRGGIFANQSDDVYYTMVEMKIRPEESCYDVSHYNITNCPPQCTKANQSVHYHQRWCLISSCGCRNNRLLVQSKRRPTCLSYKKCFRPLAANCIDACGWSVPYMSDGFPQDGIIAKILIEGEYQKLHCDCTQASPNLQSTYGWVIIQRRVNDSDDFNKTFREYERGFTSGVNSMSYWLGLKKIHQLTNYLPHGSPAKLQIEFKRSSTDVHHRYIRFNYVRVYNATNEYRLVVGQKDENSSMRNYLTSQTNRNPVFKINSNKNYSSGWWFVPTDSTDSSSLSNLNGVYDDQGPHGISWGNETDLSVVEMKLFPASVEVKTCKEACTGYNSGIDILAHLQPDENSPGFGVICSCYNVVDCTDNWIVFQRRVAADTGANFSRPLSDYKTGFGDLKNGSFWLGLQKMKRLIHTSQGDGKLLIKMTTKYGKQYILVYKKFFIKAQSSTDDENAIEIGEYDNLNSNFTGKKDVMQSKQFTNSTGSRNCSSGWSFWWWLNKADDCSLNGPYHKGHGVTWFGESSKFANYTRIEMQICRAGFECPFINPDP